MTTVLIVLGAIALPLLYGGLLIALESKWPHRREWRWPYYHETHDEPPKYL